MSDDSSDGYGSVLIVCAALSFFLGLGMGSCAKQEEAIRHNAAHYDAKTGEFTWNNPEVEPK